MATSKSNRLGPDVFDLAAIAVGLREILEGDIDAFLEEDVTEPFDAETVDRIMSKANSMIRGTHQNGEDTDFDRSAAKAIAILSPAFSLREILEGDIDTFLKEDVTEPFDAETVDRIMAKAKDFGLTSLSSPVVVSSDENRPFVVNLVANNRASGNLYPAGRLNEDDGMNGFGFVKQVNGWDSHLRSSTLIGDFVGNGGSAVMFLGSALYGPPGYPGVSIYEIAPVNDVVQENLNDTDITGTQTLEKGFKGTYGEADDWMSADSAVSVITFRVSAAGSGDVISGNQSSGVFIYGIGTTGNLIEGTLIDSGIGTTGNLVEGTLIDFNINGAYPIGNNYQGIFIGGGATSNTVSGTTAGSGNLISGNQGDGVDIDNVGTTGHVVLGSLIGTDINGKVALGDTSLGISITDGASDITIGGTAAAAGNVISGNGNYGIWLSGHIGNIVSGIVVEGNLIGTGVGGSGNIIAFNGSNGVQVGDSTTDDSIGDAILENSIYSNTQLGINLGNESSPSGTPVGGPPSGPNNLQNAPVLSSVTSSGSSTTIGSLFRSAELSNLSIAIADLRQDGGQGEPDAIKSIQALVIVCLHYAGVPVRSDTVAELTNAIVAQCLSLYGQGVLSDFSHTKMGTAEYLGAKDRIFRTVKQVVDRFRTANSHKIEIQRGTSRWDPTRDPSKRQRRVVYETQLANDVVIPSRNSEVENQIDLSLDLESAIEQLPSKTRQVVLDFCRDVSNT
jgi:hypothetical protein